MVVDTTIDDTDSNAGWPWRKPWLKISDIRVVFYRLYYHNIFIS